ncbi:MAG: 4-alpha-glucanotransferase [Methyloceanibacter sp.]|uniref:4-alpha-glucanotransferase n=1 Tax=Methyloceanibacter sp. TaxID=1965321 RepID=UPI003D9B735C
MTNRLEELAERYGIAPGYVSEKGDWVTTPPEAKVKVLTALGVKASTGAEIDASLKAAPATAPGDANVTVPQSAFWPSFLVDQRVWGLAAQIYGLRSERNWGIGDFEDLARLAESAATRGADFIGVSPLHALFLADPTRISPYSPSSRVFLNPLYIAPDKVPGFDHLPERDDLLASLPALRETEFVDYETMHPLKVRALEALFRRFTARASKEEHDAFLRYRREQGENLSNHALFEALSEMIVTRGGSVAWTSWPEDYRNRKSLAVRDFARGARRRIEFHAWLQWIADSQLTQAQARATSAGMRIGLYLDIAVGISPDGSRAWYGGPAIALHARIGCPPDPFGADGQDWGLVPFSSPGLAQERFEPFRALLRAGMRHAGAIRLDHAMGLQRLYWIPEGDGARNGAYLRYPFRQLLESVAEESWVFRCIVIAEDLGTVPPGFTDTIVRAGLLSYQVLYFAQDAGIFRQPNAFRREALVCASTHDLPTLKGWWIGNDIQWRMRANRCSTADAENHSFDRKRGKRQLLETLAQALLLPEGVETALKDKTMSDALLVAAHRFLARTPCRLFAVQIDDALGQVEQANVPGTIREHPNWQRKMAVTIEALEAHKLYAALTEAVASERPRS